jgi:hypothetical protein
MFFQINFEQICAHHRFKKSNVLLISLIQTEYPSGFIGPFGNQTTFYLISSDFSNMTMFKHLDMCGFPPAKQVHSTIFLEPNNQALYNDEVPTIVETTDIQRRRCVFVLPTEIAPCSNPAFIFAIAKMRQSMFSWESN